MYSPGLLYIRLEYFMKKIMLFAALSALAQLAVAELAFTKGAWTLKVDKASGALVQVNWNNCCISNNPAKIPLINWGPKWIAGTSSAPVKLFSHSWDEKKGILTLNTQAGDYKISETLALGYNGDKDFLSVGVAFTYVPKDPKSEFVKFNRFTCSFPITSNGKYLLAGKENLSTPERSGSFSDIRPGGGVNAGWGVPPALVEIAQDRTLVFMPEYRNDIAGFRVDKSKDGSVYARVTSAAAGWAYAGKPQHIGPFYLKVYPGPIREAFEKAIHPMYDTINLKAVNDTPAWFQDAVIYSFCAGGTVSNVTYNNVHIEDPKEYAFHFAILKTAYGIGDGVVWSPGKVENVTFNNVYIYHDAPEGSEMWGYDEENGFENITFNNVYYNGKKVTSFEEADFRRVENIKNVQFK